MTMNGAVLPVLAMYIVAAEEQVTLDSLCILCDYEDCINSKFINFDYRFK